MKDIIGTLIKYITWAIAVLTFILNFLNQFPVTYLKLAPASSVYPFIPDWATSLSGLAIAFLVVNGLQTVANVFGWNFTKYDNVIAAWLTGVVLFSANSLIGVLDPSWQARVATLFQLVQLLLGMLGTWRTSRLVAGWKIDAAYFKEPIKMKDVTPKR